MKSIILFFFVIAITTASSTTVPKAIKSLEATLERKFDQLIAAVKANAPKKPVISAAITGMNDKKARTRTLNYYAFTSRFEFPRADLSKIATSMLEFPTYFLIFFFSFFNLSLNF